MQPSMRNSPFLTTKNNNTNFFTKLKNIDMSEYSESSHYLAKSVSVNKSKMHQQQNTNRSNIFNPNPNKLSKNHTFLGADKCKDKSFQSNDSLKNALSKKLSARETF